MKKEEAGKVVLMLHLWPDQGESAAVFESLKMIEGPTRARRGCRFFGAFRSDGGGPELVLLAEWDTRDAMEGHVRSRDFRVVLAAMDTSAREPSFRVDTVESSEGFECVAGILGGGAR